MKILTINFRGRLLIDMVWIARLFLPRTEHIPWYTCNKTDILYSMYSMLYRIRHENAFSNLAEESRVTKVEWSRRSQGLLTIKERILVKGIQWASASGLCIHVKLLPMSHVLTRRTNTLRHWIIWKIYSTYLWLRRI